MGVLIIAALMGLYQILPYLINFVNGIGDLITGIIRIGLLTIGGIALFLTVSALKNTFLKALENISWKLTDFIIGLDPITTMKTDETAFWESCRAAQVEVDTWPAWKQTAALAPRARRRAREKALTPAPQRVTYPP